MDIAAAVYEIVSYHSATKIENLSDELFIEQELKLVGDDVSELLEEIQKKFEVDFLSFDFSLHFSPEVGWPENPNFGYYPVTVGHLVEVVRSKRWFLPEKNKANFSKERKKTLKVKIATVVIVALLILSILLWR
jgi:hypothetical protein